MSGFYELNPPKRDIAATHWSRPLVGYFGIGTVQDMLANDTMHVIATSPFVSDDERPGPGNGPAGLYATVIYQAKKLPVPIAEDEEEDDVE